MLPDGSDEHYRRGCKTLHDETLGCSEHKWSHDGEEMDVDECICDSDLCNKDMGPIETTSTEKTTTPEGTRLQYMYMYTHTSKNYSKKN